MTRRPDGTVVYTPFPDYEREVTDGGAVTERTTYSIAGQMVAVRVKVSGGSNTLYYTYTDHLGSVVAMSDTAGGVVSGSLARYDPFGNYRTKPATTVNPDISDRGFTGHKQNNTGSNDLGLIYMNARYYLPEVGRFISADSIVPEAEEPQSYNRYAYAQNDPVNFTDPTGHCIVGYSGDVRASQYPSGTSGICPNTEHWIIEGNAAIAEIYGERQPGSGSSSDAISLFVSLDPLETPAVNGTGGIELLYNLKSEEITLFAIAGISGTVGGEAGGRGTFNFVSNLGSDNLNYSGFFYSISAGAADGIGGNFNFSYAPSGSGIASVLPNLRSTRAAGIGPSLGLGAYLNFGGVEYIPLFTMLPDGSLRFDAGWYLFESDKQWIMSLELERFLRLFGSYAGFNPDEYDWSQLSQE